MQWGNIHDLQSSQAQSLREAGAASRLHTLRQPTVDTQRYRFRRSQGEGVGDFSLALGFSALPAGVPSIFDILAKGPLVFPMRDFRLGDIIDDHCIKCRRITNHAIVSLVNHEPAKVRCRTCYHDHDYRHEQAPPSKKDLKKQELFNEVLSSVAPAAAEAAAGDGEDPAKPKPSKARGKKA